MEAGWFAAVAIAVVVVAAGSVPAQTSVPTGLDALGQARALVPAGDSFHFTRLRSGVQFRRALSCGW